MIRSSLEFQSTFPRGERQLLHKNWDLATEEQRARITALKDKVKTDEDRAVNITFVKASEQNGKEH